jgi:hypothetical protein
MLLNTAIIIAISLTPIKGGNFRLIFKIDFLFSNFRAEIIDKITGIKLTIIRNQSQDGG